MDQRIKQKPGLSPGSANNSDLSVSHEVRAPDVNDILRAAKQAIAAAKKTIASQRGGVCGCFDDD